MVITRERADKTLNTYLHNYIITLNDADFRTEFRDVPRRGPLGLRHKRGFNFHHLGLINKAKIIVPRSIDSVPHVTANTR